MPDAFASAGLWVGLVAVPALGALCIYCMHLLLRSSHALCERTGAFSLNMEETVEAALAGGPKAAARYARVAATATRVCLVVTQVGFCCVYFEFIATSARQLLECGPLAPGLSLAAYHAILLPAVLLLSSIKQLKNLSVVSAVSNAMQFGALALILYYCCRAHGPGQTLGPHEARPVGRPAQLPIFFGIAMYAFEGIGLVLPLENKMRDPSNFSRPFGVLNTAMVCVVALYTAVGFFGYLHYGDTVEGSITLNLPSSEPLAVTVKALVTAAILLSYPLQLYVAVAVLTEAMRRPGDGRPAVLGKEYAVRYGLVLFTFGAALSINNLGLFIALVGSVSSTSLALLVPPLVHLLTFWGERGAGGRWLQTVVILTFAFLGMVTGGYTAILDLIEAKSEEVATLQCGV